MLPFRFLGWSPPLIAGVTCVLAVMAFGELSAGAMTAVGVTGAVVAGVGLVRRVGEAAAPVARSGLPWLVWLTAAVTWELVTLAADLPTLSDLTDPVLAVPALRGAATVAWLAAGGWLLTRPRYREES